jgi:catechol 2,3-dioxygenase-like lactoylglutathione lyase family enzyme
MSPSRLNLVVLRVCDIEPSAAFYRLLGLEFTRHSHGSGPQHYASEANGFVFELYPASPEQPVSASTRIGFAVADVDASAALLSAVPGDRMVSAPKDSPWGRRAVVADPDDHRVELVASVAGSV